MRTFILYARKARSDANFKINDLPSYGRMDLVCRCISSCLFLSYKKREKIKLYVVFNGPPRGPVTICFDGKPNFYPDERSIAKMLKDVLSNRIKKEWTNIEGVLIAKKSFQELIDELEGNFYVLNEKGKAVEKIKENPIFIIGDNYGIPKNEEKRILNYGEKISLGKNEYTSSTCISVLNWICDYYDID